MPERFAELIRRIIDELNGKVVLFGSKSEVGITKEIIEKVGQDPVYTSHILNTAGKTNLRELTALISECDIFITNDSGPMHIASALLVPVVAIFGSTDRTVTGPLGDGHKTVSKDIPCSPCMKRECPVSTTCLPDRQARFQEGHLKCMTEITTDDVFNALQEILPNEKAVFLDRDGTLIEDIGYLNSFSNLKMFVGIKEALQGLKKAGFKLIGVTNQSGIAHGLVSKEFVNASNAYLQENLGIDCFYYCPHHPDNGCQCRKPKPMLLRKAKLEHRINLKASYVIGDKTIDVLLAKAVGAKGILVLTGHDKESEHADFIAQNLTEAVDWILKREKT
jgi:heptosyltransferase-2